MFKMFSFLKGDEKNDSSLQAEKPLVNEVIEINKKEAEYNKLGSIEKIIEKWVPQIINEFVAENDLDERKIGLLKSPMGGKSHVIKEINTGDINNQAKTYDAIKATIYPVLESYCQKERIYRDKAA